MYEKNQGREVSWLLGLKTKCVKTLILAMPCSTQIIFYSFTLLFHVKFLCLS